jgi:hypothetical protein
MAENRITITIDEQGRVSASTEGFKGELCLEELEKLLGELGDQATLKKTDEFFQQEIRPNSNIQKNQRQ